MADITNDTQAQLQAALEAAKANGAKPTPTQSTTTNGVPDAGVSAGAPATPASTKEKKTKEKLSNIMAKYLQSSDVKKTVITKEHPAFKVKQFMSQCAQICGFITPFNSRVDVTVQKVGSEYNIGLKEKMSSNYKGVIVKYPGEVVTLLNDQLDSTEEVGATADHGSLKSIQEKYINDPSKLVMFTRILDKASFFIWASRYCHVKIQEALSIYHPHYVARSKKGADGQTIKLDPERVTAPDKKGNYYLIEETIAKIQKKAEAGAYDKAKGKVPTVTDLFKLKSSYRGTLIVEGNYIAMERYETTKFKSSYSQEEVDKLNQLYVEAAFPKKEEAFADKVANLSDAAKQLVTNLERGKFQSKIFATSGSYYADANNASGIRRYYSKYEFFNPNDIPLVLKTENEKTGKPKLSKIPFGEPGNTLDMYPQIQEACGKSLTTDMVKEFIASIKSSKSSTSERTAVEHDIAYDPEAVLQGIIATL